MYTAEVLYTGEPHNFRPQAARLARRHPHVFFQEQDGLRLKVSALQKEALQPLAAELGWELRLRETQK